MTRALAFPLTRAVLVVTTVAAIVVPSATMAQREDDAAFKAGMDARKNKQWAEMATQMQKAVEEDRKESTRKIGGIFARSDYLPYYFLGEAYFMQANCAAAVVAWEESERQGIVRTRPQFLAEIQKGKSVCDGKGILLTAKFEAAVSRARAQLDNLHALLGRVKDKGSAHPDIWRSRPAFEAEYGRASADYDTARKQLTEAQRSRLERDFGEVGKAAERAVGTLDSLESDLNAAVERGSANVTAAAEVWRTIEDAKKVDAAIESKKAFLTPSLMATRADGLKKLADAQEQLDPRRLNENMLATSRSAAAEGANLLNAVLEGVDVAFARDVKLKLERATGFAAAAFSRTEAELQTVQSLLVRKDAKVTPEVRQDVEAARTQFQSAVRRRDAAIRGQQVAGVESATRQVDLVQEKLIAIEKALGVTLTLADRGVPPWLQAGATQYLAGNYAGALDKLDDGEAEGDAVWHVHVFRAAALHALYVRSGEKDTARRDQAIADVKRCKSLEPTRTPDARAFSPRFLDFYQRDGAPSQASAAR